MQQGAAPLNERYPPRGAAWGDEFSAIKLATDDVLADAG